MKKETVLKIVLIAISAYNLLLGGLVFVSGNTASLIAKVLFDMNLNPAPQLLYFAKLLGIYALFFGVAMLVAAWKPVKYKILIDLAIALYVVRIINRVIFADLVQSAFNVSSTMMWVEVLLLTLFGGLLLLFRPKEN